MVRKLFAAVLALVVFAGVSLAAEIKGKVKSVDADKNTITVTTKDGDKTVKLSKDTKFSGGGKDAAEKLAAEGIKWEGFSKGPQVTITTEGEGDKEMATKVVVGGGRPKDNK